jgi:AcrR family transcriptional regulator
LAGAATTKTDDTKKAILQAAQKVLSEHGFAGLSTRRVADAAEMPMSQIRYHFGSKEGMILALFEDMNAALLDRQQAMFSDPSLPLSKQWDLACDFLEDDINSGYVRVLQELIAAGWSNPAIGAAVVESLDGWQELLVDLARRMEKRLGRLAPLNAEEIAALISVTFVGAESQILLGQDSHRMPIRRALRRIGEIMRRLETSRESGG